MTTNAELIASVQEFVSMSPYVVREITIAGGKKEASRSATQEALNILEARLKAAEDAIERASIRFEMLALGNTDVASPNVGAKELRELQMAWQIR